MNKSIDFHEINEVKTNFDTLYDAEDPREYFKYLGQLDYIIPHLANPVFEQLIRARAERQSEPVTVVDIGSSYGLNGALMKYALNFDALRGRYTNPALQPVSSEELLEYDRNYYRSWPKHPRLRVIGLDVSENAVRYAETCGTVDVGMAIDLESRDPTPEEARILADADIIISTGAVGYVTSRTFERLMQIAQKDRPTWVASFVLRMFPYRPIEEALAKFELQTEQFEGATFVQRRFSSVEEMEATVHAVEARGLDTRGKEAQGLFHAEFFLSRSPGDIDRVPLQKLINVASGADKPWIVGTNVLGGFGPGARKRARSAHSRKSLDRRRDAGAQV
jgi:hypothetical protein